MKTRRFFLSAASLSVCALTSASQAQSIAPIGSFDPNTYFVDNFLAGIDFDDDSDGSTAGNQLVTEPGFTSIAPSNNKTYNVVNNGITFDLVFINANQANQNRWRNNATAGALTNDFEQWYGRHATPGNAVEGKVTISGLTASTEYEVSIFTMNLGAGNTTHNLYNGASSASPLIGTFSTSGTPSNFATYNPGTVLTTNADSNGEIIFTIQAIESLVGANYESRLGLNGISIVSTGPAFDPADLDQDGDVDDADFGIAFAAFTGPGGVSTSPADLDQDGDVDDADFGIAFAAFTGPGGSAAVPEPTSLALLGLGGLMIARRRRA